MVELVRVPRLALRITLVGLIGALAVLVAGFGGGFADGADEPATDATTAFMMSTVRAYTVRGGGTLDRELKLHPRPILKWTNPVSGIEHGALVMWRDEERPMVFAQVFKIPAPENFWLHEAQSVASSPLEFRLEERVTWNPKRGGAEFAPLQGADAPTGKGPALLVQVKTLARRFATTEDFRTTPASDATKFELRLVTQPLYQYQSVKLGVLTGCVFAFVNGTDPEVLLVLEARTAQGSGTAEQPAWHYLLCPMTCWKTSAEFDKQPIWSVEEQFGKTGRTDPYFVWRMDESLAKNDPTEK
jgi:hypothetical protein